MSIWVYSAGRALDIRMHLLSVAGSFITCFLFPTDSRFDGSKPWKTVDHVVSLVANYIVDLILYPMVTVQAWDRNHIETTRCATPRPLLASGHMGAYYVIHLQGFSPPPTRAIAFFHEDELGITILDGSTHTETKETVLESLGNREQAKKGG